MAKKEPRSLYGQVVAITGAARGIGKATARALARQGARVGIGDLDVELARKTAEELGGSVEAFSLNVCDRASFSHFLDEVERTLGPVDVLINNAGIMPLGSFDEEDDATTLRQIDINVVGVMTGCKLVIPKMKQRGRGHIVNIASMAGRAGYANAVTYCTTKFAVVVPLRGLAGRAARHRDRALGRVPGRGQHRARLRPERDPRGQGGGARGGR